MFGLVKLMGKKLIFCSIYLYQTTTSSTIVRPTTNFCRWFWTAGSTAWLGFHMNISLPTIHQFCAFYPIIDMRICVSNAWFIKYGSIRCIITEFEVKKREKMEKHIILQLNVRILSIIHSVKLPLVQWLLINNNACNRCNVIDVKFSVNFLFLQMKLDEMRCW